MPCVHPLPSFCAGQASIPPTSSRPVAAWPLACYQLTVVESLPTGVGIGIGPSLKQGPPLAVGLRRCPTTRPLRRVRAPLESVDGCLLGTTLPRQSEASPGRLPPPRGRGPAEGILPLRGPDHTLRWRSGARPRCGRRPLGKLSGGNRMAGRALCSTAPGTRTAGGFGPPSVNCSAPLVGVSRWPRPPRSR